MSENEAIVNKFKPHGSSLFYRIIKGNIEKIIEDEKALRLINNEVEFEKNISSQIQTYLGK